MIKLFRNMRRNDMEESNNKILPTTKYFKYAIGEIVLVVIGILIALSINNWNDARKTRAKEVHYLKNIVTDLNKNTVEMQKFLEVRSKSIAAAGRILENFEGKPIEDYSAFNADAIPIYAWKKFWQSNNTFQELVNSGNLALISNDSIKNMLLDLESTYVQMKSEEDHYRYDTEVLFYEQVYEMMDVMALVSDFEHHVSKGQSGKNQDLKKETFEAFLKNKKIKNGFTMTVFEYTIMNQQMQKMIDLSNGLIKAIHKEIKK